MRTTKLFSLLALLVFFFGGITEVDAQKKKNKKKKGKTEQSDKDTESKDFDEIAKKCSKSEGLFTVLRDTVTGKSYLEIREDQLEKEYIYFSYVEDGALEAGFFRGSYRGSKIITFQKHYDRIEIQTENTSFYFDPENALSKSADANINHPIIASQKIEAEKKDSSKAVTYLIDGDAIFLSEQFQMVKPPSHPKYPSLLGSLSKDKTKINKINNYPENTEVTVTYVYDNKSPKRGGSEAVTDVRNISVKYQHSLLQVPDNNFEPRRDDSRIGFFMTQVNDMTSFSATPYKDIIHRWNLEKKDKGADVSEPIEPITFWIENTTPVEFRPIIKEGVERWNLAFEKAGFKNAVVVNIQPDDAEWDAGDIRYNVLRWTSSPIPPFGGYGPSFVNPRTGEILGADIMLEFVSITNRMFKTDVFELAGFDAYMDEELDESNFDQHSCQAGEHMHHNLIFGLSAMRVNNASDAAKEDFIKQSLYRLVLHEVGHTLGMTHNMHGSTLLSPEEIKNKVLVEQMGLCNSVMEYPSINYARDKKDQTLYYDVRPGVYDEWVIEYGYSEGLEDETSEEKRLGSILERSTNPNLAYGNDADDMRSPGKAIDPNVNIYDLSNDPVAYAKERCELVNDIMPKLLEKYTIDDQSYHELRNAYYVLSGEYITQVMIMTRQIGGVHYDRSFPGQNSELDPLYPVSEKGQKAAMQALADYAFSSDALEASEELYKHLISQRRGFDHFMYSIDPKIHRRIEQMHEMCLMHLLHKNVLLRITDSQQYGNTYSLSEYMGDLTDAVFKTDLKKKVNTFRQNLQINYVKRLININGEKSRYDNISKSMGLYEMNRIEKMMKSAYSPDTMTKAHRSHILLLIKNAKEEF